MWPGAVGRTGLHSRSQCSITALSMSIRVNVDRSHIIPFSSVCKCVIRVLLSEASFGRPDVIGRF